MDFLEEELEEILNIFRAESEEHIQKINQCLLRLEANPKDAGVISELFREAHSIKGAARMIGLNDIQNLAHKLEDILGLAKDGILEVNAKIVDVLCATVDCISSIVEESIETKGASHSSVVDQMMEKLIEIEKSVETQKNTDNLQESVKKSEIVEAYDENLGKILENFVNNSSYLIPEIRKDIEQLKVSSIDSDTISNLHKLVIELDNSTVDINVFEIREPIQDIRMKLDGVFKGSGILLDAEVSDIEEAFDNFIKNFEKVSSIFEVSILESINNIMEVFEAEIVDSAHQEVIIPDIGDLVNNDPEISISYIDANLLSLADNSPNAPKIIETIMIELKNLIEKTSNDNAKTILEKILELSILSKDNSTKPSIDIAEAIKQSFQTASQLILSPGSLTEDINLVIQRLTILQQMLKLSEQEPTVYVEEEKKEENNSAPKVDFSPLSQSTDLLPQNEPQAAKLSDGDKALDNTTIKTLRVDTKKLDQLVSQAGELIIAKIKAKEHLSEIEKIIRSVEDWYREWNKAKQLVKYMDRKPIRPNELPSGTSIYSHNKSIYSIFEESSSRLSMFMNQMNSLYRIIQEDDTRLNLIVNELEERIKSVRVLPLATIFHMFPRMVRDIAREKNKDIDLIISGSETSVDKKIIEEIKSPLMHIIRNAIDHGIEEPEVRRKNGKNPTGKIMLSAYHLENSVLIEIIDDGKGIDLEAIKRKVLQKGLLTPAELQSMNDNQIMNIIFWPGFSTGETVTDISGRGVGLDIVHTKITQLNGKVNIKSTIGEGCQVSIQLPVTMATIKSFLVRVNDQTFAIPTSAIKTALLIKPEEIFYKEGKETIIVDNKTVPVCRLSKVLEMSDSTANPDKIVLIIIQAEDVQVGFIIDKLLGDQEILHKNLTPPLLRVKNIAGVTTLGSGELCLILNVNDLVKSAYLSIGMSKKQLVINKESSTSVIKKKILVVDDSVTTRILERNILKAAGYEVTVAINGLDALTKIVSDKFDLVVSDVEMPEINGFELTERLRQNEKFKTIPIILVTSLASEIDKKKGLSLGANAYITKGNFDQAELLSTIKKLIS